ncbi:hypothetical protein V6N12_065296 [Hibiscus sabdariffa]|uniref:Uncharacterized protein n=1 Tax=Hibiscus sabdariffa TaxID=183260 RepID=A0ABR2G8B0_9ROSI
MSELEQSSITSSYIGRDVCPDSLIFTPESNFSSPSASVNRGSFAYDAQPHDHDPLASQLSLVTSFFMFISISQFNAYSTCQDMKKEIKVHNHNRLSRKRDKVKGARNVFFHH